MSWKSYYKQRETTQNNSRKQLKGTMSATVRAKEIERLRELHKPTDFDAWVCLGGDYRDQAEVQEWASREEGQELSRAYTDFRRKSHIANRNENWPVLDAKEARPDDDEEWGEAGLVEETFETKKTKTI